MKKSFWLVLMISFIFVFSVSSAQAKTLKADVVVIGGGGAGMPAAVAAAEGGAKVIVFEKADKLGGKTNFLMGLAAVESTHQRKRNVPLTKAEVFKFFMEDTNWRANARIVSAYINKSADTIDWLEKQGVEFELLDYYQYPGATITGHIIQGPPGYTGVAGRGVFLIKALEDKAKEKGVEIYLTTPVKKILKKGDRIVGVMIMTTRMKNLSALSIKELSQLIWLVGR